MNFKKATDVLFSTLTATDLARATGASVQAIKQARAAEGTSSHRTPPQNWEDAVVKLAERQAARLSKLASTLGDQK